MFLSPDRRKAIVAAANLYAAALLRGLELTGARPKERAAAKVGGGTMTKSAPSTISRFPNGNRVSERV